MKKQILLILSLILIVGCGDDILLSPANQENYREVAYNSLSNGSKESLIINWRDAKVVNGVYEKDGERHKLVLDSKSEISFVLDEQYPLYKNQRLVAVIFNTDLDPLVGPIIIIVDPMRSNVVGFGLRA